MKSPDAPSIVFIQSFGIVYNERFFDSTEFSVNTFHANIYDDIPLYDRNGNTWAITLKNIPAISKETRRKAKRDDSVEISVDLHFQQIGTCNADQFKQLLLDHLENTMDHDPWRELDIQIIRQELAVLDTVAALFDYVRQQTAADSDQAEYIPMSRHPILTANSLGNAVQIEIPSEKTTLFVNVTHIGDDQYRLESVPIGSKSVGYGDIIEAILIEEGRLKLVGVTEQSRWQRYRFDIRWSAVDYPAFSAILDQIRSRGGYWEHIYSGHFEIWLAPEIAWDPTTDILHLNTLASLGSKSKPVAKVQQQPESLMPMQPMMQRLKIHFQNYRKRKPWDFCWRIAIEGTVVSLAAVILLNILQAPPRDMNMDRATIIIVGLLGAPIIETLLFQAFPIWIARLCKARFAIQLIASIIPFFLAHTVEGISTGIGAGLISGFYLAFTYAHFREQTRWRAYWTTAVSHAIHNAIIISIAMSLGEI